MSIVCLGTSMSSCLTRLEWGPCAWKGRKKGRQNILRILMYIGGEIGLNSHTHCLEKVLCFAKTKRSPSLKEAPQRQQLG